MKRALLKLFRFYQTSVSPLFPPRCRYIPTCSEYAVEVNIGYSKVINLIGASTFGVLLIHANSDIMRQWLWQDILNNVGQYGTNTMVLHAIYSVLMVYAVCTVIDYLRMKHFGEMVYEAD